MNIFEQRFGGFSLALGGILLAASDVLQYIEAVDNLFGIRIVGRTDDLLIVRLGIWLALKLIPDEVMDEHRRAADATIEYAPREPCWTRRIFLHASVAAVRSPAWASTVPSSSSRAG